MEVICVFDKGRPENIPISKWVKKGDKYTIINVERMLMQDGVYGVKLAEIDLSDYFPYTRFASTRFKVVNPTEDLVEELENMVEEVY